MENLNLRLEGYLTGQIWWPVGQQCGKQISIDISREMARFTEKPTLRDIMLLVLREEGGDFQSAELAADCVIVATYYKPNRKITRYWEVANFPSIRDLVNQEYFGGDFE